MLFDDGSETKPTNYTVEDMANAITLRDAVISKAKVRRGWSRKSWAKQMAIGRTEVKDKLRFNQVLCWYVKHIGEDYVPESYSAESFRKKFLSIEKAMERDLKRNPVVTIGKPARDMIVRLRRGYWPAGCEEKLPAAVQVTMDRFHDFCRKIAELEVPKKYEQVRRVFYRRLPGVSDFTETWFNSVRLKIKDWKGWNGELMDFAFKQDSKMFRQYGRDLVNSVCGKPDYFDKIMECL